MTSMALMIDWKPPWFMKNLANKFQNTLLKVFYSPTLTTLVTFYQIKYLQYTQICFDVKFSNLQ